MCAHVSTQLICVSHVCIWRPLYECIWYVFVWNSERQSEREIEKDDYGVAEKFLDGIIMHHQKRSQIKNSPVSVFNTNFVLS